MIELLEDIFSSPGFWILWGFGAAATLMGWKLSQGMGDSFSIWTILIIIAVEGVAAAFFALRE